MKFENIIGVEEASSVTGLSPGYIKNLCAAGKIKAKKIGNVWVIDSRTAAFLKLVRKGLGK